MAGHEGAARLHGQNIALRDALDAERQRSATMRETARNEQQNQTDNAFQGIFTDLLRKQEEAVSMKAQALAKERDLETRARMIQQMERFLSLGQRQIYIDFERLGIPTLTRIERRDINERATMRAERELSYREGVVNQRIESLLLRESTQKLREEQYKKLIYESLKAELSEAAVPSERAEEMAKIEYDRGFAAGQKARIAASLERAKERDFSRGYAACYDTNAALNNLRQGRIALGAPELAFLEAGHPDNPFNRGRQLSEAIMASSEEASGDNSSGPQSNRNNDSTPEQSILLEQSNNTPEKSSNIPEQNSNMPEQSGTDQIGAAEQSGSRPKHSNVDTASGAALVTDDTNLEGTADEASGPISTTDNGADNGATLNGTTNSDIVPGEAASDNPHPSSTTAVDIHNAATTENATNNDIVPQGPANENPHPSPVTAKAIDNGATTKSDTGTPKPSTDDKDDDDDATVTGPIDDTPRVFNPRLDMPRRRVPPPRPITLTEELRGTPLPMYNGFVVVANHAAIPPPVASPRFKPIGRAAEVGPDLIDFD